MASFDTAIIGAGVIGSAAACALARRSRRVVAIDRFTPGHDRGSSHGATRIIRLGYFEHPSYVPLVRTAHALWRELEARTGTRLMRVTGVLETGTPASALIAGTLRAAREHRLAHEVLSAAQMMKRFPALTLPEAFVGVLQPDGGVLEAEGAVAAFQAAARTAGAELRFGERVLALEGDGEGVRVRTQAGEIRAGSAIVAAGPWVNTLLCEPLAALRVTRQVMFWFAPASPCPFAFPSRDYPVFLLQEGEDVFYGFPPDAAGLVKVARHHHRDETVPDPDHYPRTLLAADESVMRAMLRTRLPAADGPLTTAKTCLYTMAGDGDFIIDRLAARPQIILASPCSGHGFKFAPVIGEILADLAVAGRTGHDISRFSLRRF